MFSLDGRIRPAKAKMSPRNRAKNIRIWPGEQPGDRVEEQLMFVPPNYRYDNAPLKTVLLYNDAAEWNVQNGQGEFVSNQCPVYSCSITTNELDAPNADAIIFRDRYHIPPMHKKPKNQVSSNGPFKVTFYSESKCLC